MRSRLCERAVEETPESSRADRFGESLRSLSVDACDEMDDGAWPASKREGKTEYEDEAAEEEAGEAEVRVRDARSGSSRDFFLLRRERWTLWEDADGLGLECRAGDWAWRAGESRRALGL